MGMPSPAELMENSKTQEEPQKSQTYEEWRVKKNWSIHKRGVSDLAWSPDNIHFASCGTDSLVIIWSINETGKIFAIYLRFHFQLP